MLLKSLEREGLVAMRARPPLGSESLCGTIHNQLNRLTQYALRSASAVYTCTELEPIEPVQTHVRKIGIIIYINV